MRWPKFVLVILVPLIIFKFFRTDNSVSFIDKTGATISLEIGNVSNLEEVKPILFSAYFGEFDVQKLWSTVVNDFTSAIKMDKTGPLFIIARKDKKPVGFSIFYYEGDGVFLLEPLMIDPSMQGRGLGRELTFEIQKWFEVSHIIVLTEKINSKAIAFYEKVGFTEVNLDSVNKDVDKFMTLRWSS